MVQAVSRQDELAQTIARLSLTIQEQALFLQLSHAITRVTLENTDLGKTLDLLAKRVVEILPVAGCSISLWDPRKQTLSLRAAAGPERRYHLGDALSPAETSTLMTALDTGRAYFPAAGQLPQGAAETPDHPGNAALVLPMRNETQKIGAILVEFPDQRDRVTEDELRRWEEMVAHIQLAITSVLTNGLETKHIQEAELLQQATITIASSLDLQEVLSQILTSLKQVVPFDSGAICLIENEYLRIAAQGGSAWHFKEVGDRIEKSAGLFSLLKTAHAPVYLADAQQHPNYQEWSAEGKVLIHAWMGVPLIAYNHTIGYLLLNSQEYDVYTPDHARLAQAFASQAALAIEKARLFEQVRNGRERIRAVSKKLVEIQEEERRFIAHELHDEIGQELTGLQFLLEMGKEGDEAAKLQALVETQELVRGLMSQVRELSINLHPTMLDDLGLLPALNAHFSRFQQTTGMHVHFVHQNLEQRFSPDLEVSAFRVVQEALTNAARYAGAKEINVKITSDNAALTIEIADYGQGFDARILQDSSLSFGIAGMRERTELVGGKFDIQSSPGHGTWIVAVFPNGYKVERRKSDRSGSARR